MWDAVLSPWRGRFIARQIGLLPRTVPAAA
jgi:hypothetical protein